MGPVSVYKRGMGVVLDRAWNRDRAMALTLTNEAAGPLINQSNHWI